MTDPKRDDAMFKVPVTVPDPNPCVAAFGVGPTGSKCRDCAKFLRSWGRWPKCEYRRRSACSSTDHRAGWNACAKFVEVTP